MKTYTKILSMLLCVFIVLSLVSCGISNSERIIIASQKSSELTSFDMDMKMTLSGTLGENEINIPLTAKIICEAKDEENLNMYVNMTASMSGITINSEIYLVDDIIYIDVFGMKLKEAATKENLDDLDMDDNQLTFPVTFTDDMLKEAVIEEDEKNLNVSVVIDSALLNDYIKAQCGSMFEQIYDETIDYTISDVNMSFVVNEENYISHCTIDASVTITADDVSQTFDVEIEMTYNNPGQPVTVSAPEDADSYTEYSE